MEYFVNVKVSYGFYGVVILLSVLFLSAGIILDMLIPTCSYLQKAALVPAIIGGLSAVLSSADKKPTDQETLITKIYERFVKEEKETPTAIANKKKKKINLWFFVLIAIVGAIISAFSVDIDNAVAAAIGISLPCK